MITEYNQYSFDGLVSDQLNPTYLSGNCILFTAHMLAINEQYGNKPSDPEKLELMKALNKECVITSGLIRRNALNNDQESIDDHIGWGFISSRVNKQLAKDVLNYGKLSYYIPFPKLSFIKFPYYYPNENPLNRSDSRAWLGRFPALLAHLEWAYGGKPSLLKRLWWCSSLVTNSAKEKDGWILSWLMIKTLPPGTWLEKPFVTIHQWRLKKSWGTMKTIFSEYFTDQNYPTTVFCKE